ncbi:hypothetical protein C8J57DRAFT_658892 [Mycena rebaudengoi]|nr:hypothetical protein C8J57DRAFT_658892 [Mycena rebaudengoi]
MMSFVDRCTEMALEHKKSFGDLSVDDYYSLSFDFSMTQDFPLGSARSTINVESIDQPHASPTTKAKKRKQGSLESESAVPAATNRKILPVPSSSRLRQEDIAERKNGTASTTPPLIIRLPPLRALASGHRSSHSNPSQAAATIPIAGPSNASLPTQVLFPTTNLGDGSSISPADLSASPTLRRSQSSGYCPPGPRSNPLNSSGQNSPPTSEATPSRLSENNNQFVTRTRSISGRAYPTIPAPAPRASVTRSLERSSSGHEHSAIVRGGQRSEDHGHGQTLR